MHHQYVQITDRGFGHNQVFYLAVTTLNMHVPAKLN